jgi:hypothetical protein
MSQLEGNRQYAREADRVAANHRALGLPGVARDAKIASQPRTRFQLPTFLEQTTSPASHQQLVDLLSQVNVINEQFVGEYVLEVESYLSVTRQDYPLSEALRLWTERYLRERIARPNPLRDGVDPVRTFQRLEGELARVLESLALLPNSVANVFLNEPMGFGLWFLFDQLLRPRLEITRDGDQVKVSAAQTADHGVLRQAGRYMEAFRWYRHDLPEFLEICRTGLGNQGQPYAADVQDAIDEYMGLILEMRPFLLETRPELLQLEMSGGRRVLWRWATGMRLANLVLVSDERELLSVVKTQKARLYVGVNPFGLLTEPKMLWLTTAAPGPVAIGADDLATNLTLIRGFFECMHGLYERIDFDAIRARRRQGQAPTEIDDAELAVATSDLEMLEPAASVPDAVTVPGKPWGQRLRSMRLSVLLRLLERHFGCEVRQGKGSEVTAYRPGARKFIFGSHGSGVTVSVVLLGMALRALGIAREDWVRLAHGQRAAGSRSRCLA